MAEALKAEASPDDGTPIEPAATPISPEPAPSAAAALASEVPRKFVASIANSQRPLPLGLALAAQELERTLGQPLWLLLHSGQADFSDSLRASFFTGRGHLPEGEPVAILIDSPGGYAKSAYQIAHLLRTHCGSFTAVIPRYAKSAATLFALGADTILISKYAELGPIDAQLYDPEREEHTSALNEVQALERLHAFAMEAVDKTMFLLLPRTGKKTETLLPLTMHFVTELIRPLFEKIDVVHYTYMARILKVAEEYATRLLKPRYNDEQATAIARHLMESYPDHGFFIDGSEAATVGLKLAYPTDDQNRIMDIMMPFLGKITAVGQVMEVTA